MTLVETFVTKVIAESTFEELDRIYLTNRVLALVGDGVLEVKTGQDNLIDLKDQLVEEAVRLETIEDSLAAREILGARMTGAGFGGCAIALVQKDAVESFKEAVGKHYEEIVGYAPSFYIAEVAGGTRVLD